VAGLDAQSLQHLVIVLPADGARPAELDRLPPALASGNWPRASEAAGIAELVKARLGATPSPLSRRYADVEGVKARLLELAASPPPLSLAGKRTYPARIPPPLKTFVGRSHDLWRVDFALSTLGGGAAGAARAVDIEGGGGFGKSALAREYLHRFGPARFPGGLFWINAEDPLDAQFHGVLQTLRPVPEFPEFQKDHRDAGRELAVALHAEAAKAPILWVVDNVPEDGRPLREYCPALGAVSVLTTSRRKPSALDESVSPLPIGVLDAASAIDLLAAEVSPAPPRPDCELVVEWVGRLPVALAVLNGSLRLKRLTLAELVVAAHGREGLPGGVEQAFGLSYDRLSRGAQEAARLIARLAPSAVPMGLLDHLGLWPETGGELVGTSFVGEVDPEPRDAHSELPMLGTMHAVVADYVRSRATDATAEVVRGVAAVTTMLGEASNARDQWRVLLRCAPHARHLLRLTRPDGSAFQVPLVLRAVLADALSKASTELCPREGAMEAFQETVEAFRPLQKMAPDAFEPDLAAALNNLASCLSQMGRRGEALTAAEEAVEIRRRLAQARPQVFERDLAESLRQAAEIHARIDQKRA